LLPASTGKLDALVKGLYERPGLQIEIEGSIDSKADLDALRRGKLEKELREKKWKSLRRSEQARLKPEEVQLTPEERADYLKAAYTVAFSPEAIAARTTQDGTNTSMTTRGSSTNRSSGAPAPERNTPDFNRLEKGATALLRVATATELKLPAKDMEAQMLETIPVTTSDFESLATKRAQRVKEYILKDGKVEPERIFLTQSGREAVTTKGSRVYLHLQ
jgi:hypothetical protein